MMRPNNRKVRVIILSFIMLTLCSYGIGYSQSERSEAMVHSALRDIPTVHRYSNERLTIYGDRMATVKLHRIYVYIDYKTQYFALYTIGESGRRHYKISTRFTKFISASYVGTGYTIEYIFKHNDIDVRMQHSHYRGVDNVSLTIPGDSYDRTYWLLSNEPITDYDTLLLGNTLFDVKSFLLFTELIHSDE